MDYAEANNEAYDTSAARELCLKYLNKVRERAGVRQYTFDAVSDLDENFIHIENTQAAVRKVVKAERRVELCLENNRWYDLRRWKDVENTPEMIGDDYGMNSEELPMRLSSNVPFIRLVYGKDVTIGCQSLLMNMRRTRIWCKLRSGSNSE